ncbi:MAG TPA: hypothetical protein VJT68_03385 [Thermoleophilaceae bacterium]|nr:hypothetical protein [Thermoleophilaceae bacterium]
MKANTVVVEMTHRRSAATKESRAIAAVLPVAIALGRALGWSSERTYREAESWAMRGGRVIRE